MRFVILLSLVLLIVISCRKEEIDYENSRTSYYVNAKDSSYRDSVFRCVTFNIQLGFTLTQDPWNKDEKGVSMEQVKRIAGLLKQADPDIIALQEVPRNRYNAEVKDFLEQLAGEMKMNFAFGSHGYNDPYGIYPVYGEWGIAILTKYRIQSIRNEQIEYVSKWEKRSLLDVVIETGPDEVMHVISLHLLPSEEGILNSAKFLSKLPDPVICMGDFNYMGEIPEYSAIGFQDADSTYEKHGIDRILYTKSSFKCLELETLSDDFGISDHNAHLAVLKRSR